MGSAPLNQCKTQRFREVAMEGIQEAFLGLFIFSVYWPILIVAAAYGLMERKKKKALAVAKAS